MTEIRIWIFLSNRACISSPKIRFFFELVQYGSVLELNGPYQSIFHAKKHGFRYQTCQECDFESFRHIALMHFDLKNGRGQKGNFPNWNFRALNFFRFYRP